MLKLTGYFSKDKVCDQHASTQGYESCCACKNDDPNDKRMCFQVKENKNYSKNRSSNNLGLVVDGIIGPKTIKVIKKWQGDNGLVADGLVGRNTKAKMNAEAN